MMKERLNGVLNEPHVPHFRVLHLTLGALALVSLVLAIMEAMARFAEYRAFLNMVQWAITILFTIEYALRIWVAERKSAYIFGFWGVSDLASILPSFLGLGNFGFLKAGRVIRAMRFVRVLGVANTPKYFRGKGDGSS